MLLFLNGRAIRKYDLLDGHMIWETQNLERSRDGSQASEVEEYFVAPTMYSGYAPMVLAYRDVLFYNRAPRWEHLAWFVGSALFLVFIGGRTAFFFLAFFRVGGADPPF